MRFIFFILSSLWVFLSFSQEDSLSFFDKYSNQHYGTYIRDFSFVSSEDTGRQQNLYSLQTDSIYIFFYDPFCDHCKKEIKHLKKDKNINKAIKEKTLVFLTIAPDIDYSVWQKTVKKMPEQWINAYSEERLQLIKQLLWKVPELFVADKQKRILYINMYREDLEYE